MYCTAYAENVNFDMNTNTQSERNMLMKEGYPAKAGSMINIIDRTLMMLTIVKRRTEALSERMNYQSA